ncbi:MAG: isoleucine--tRNA ligase [Gemmatimonadetes bacterium]|nr:isoleucine--tRNA ligase [Gemmatimonadota bacterium]
MGRFPVWPDGGADRLEQSVLERWRVDRLFHQVEARRKGDPPFVFFEGPPTANGRPGIHHVFSRTIKDLFCRFRSMQGRAVTRIAGWDTHGLPVEIEIEKRLQLKGKKDIEAFGVEAFNRLCRESVFTYQNEWVALSDRIGYWLDYDRPYVTCTKEYIESVWWLLQRLHQKGLLVRGHRVLPYCPRCGTTLSSHELSLGYAEVRDKSIYVTFPLEDGTGRELVVWTTTPWTVACNVAAAVHPDLEYGTYRMPDGRRLVVTTARASILLSGKDAPPPAPDSVELGAALVGKPYRRPIDVFPMPPGAHSIVVGADFVTAADGSGIVGMAPAFGAEDYATGQQHGLAMLRPVAPDGTFTGSAWLELEGALVTADSTTELIIRRLKADGHHLKTEQYVHSYPHCWRCKSKLIYYAKDSWFVRTSAVKERMVALNQTINWHPPEVGTGRFGEWLANNVDWALSRDRYWGTPLPIWVSDADPDVIEVVGSLADLERHLGRKLPEDFDPHKPFIDDLTWPAPAGGTMRRVSEVIDTWFDSGSMPYAQWHYPFEHQAEFKGHFPADFICEGVDQTRGWFYSLLAIGTAVFDEIPYRNVVVNELVLDAEGQKMSKSKGNVVDPWAAVGEFGADQVRLYLLASSQVWLPKPFDRAAIPDTAGGFLNTLRNTYNFFALYVTEAPAPALSDSLLDRWIRSRLASTVQAVTAAWDGYDATTGVRAVMDFVDELSNWYVRQSRARFWAPGRDADPAAAATLAECLVTVTRLIGPAAPFASDWMHQALVGQSVHLADFPRTDSGVIDPDLERAMDGIRRLASLGRSAREAGNRRVRQTLGTMRVAVPKEVDNARFRDLLELLAQEMNVKAVEVVSSDRDLVRLKAKGNFRNLGKRFAKDTPRVAALVATLPAGHLHRLDHGETVTTDFEGTAIDLGPDDVLIEREVTSDWLVQSAGPFVVALDPVITPDLARDGLAREIVSRVQRLRKDAGYEYTTRIVLSVAGDAAVLEAVRAHHDFVQGETLAERLLIDEVLDPRDARDDARIDDHQVTLAVGRAASHAPLRVS